MSSKNLKNNIFSLCLYLILISSASADAKNLILNWELDGLSNPESVIYDPKLNHL